MILRASLAWLLASACLPKTELSIPARDDAVSFALIVFEGGRPIAVAGIDPAVPLALSIDDSARLVLLAFDRRLEDLGLEPHIMQLAREGEEGRSLPEPIGWTEGSLDAFGEWTSDPLPDDVDAIELAGLDFKGCWGSGGCVRVRPLRCEVACKLDAVVEPNPPERGAEPVDFEVALPRPPRWDPGALADCPPGDAHWYGDEACSPIGAACPARFSPKAPAGAIYIDLSESTDGDGSIDSPRNRIPDPIPGTIVLAAGSYDFGPVLLSGVAIYGACLATELARVVLSGSELHDLRLLAGAHIEGSGNMIDGVESLGGILIVGDAIATELAMTATIGVTVAGSLSADRFYAERMRGSAILVAVGGTLSLRDAVVAGTTSLVGHGALSLYGEGEIDGAYVENAEQLGILAIERYRIQDAVVRGLRTTPPNPGGRSSLWLSGRGTAERILIDQSHERSVTISSSSTISDLVVRGQVRGSDSSGEGMHINNARLLLERVALGETGAIGMQVSNTTGTIRDLTVLPERSSATPVYVVNGSKVKLEKIVLGGVHENAITASDSELTVEDAIIHDLIGDGSAINVYSVLRPVTLIARSVHFAGIPATSIGLKSFGPPVRASIEELTIEDAIAGIYAEGPRGGVQLEARYVNMGDVNYPLALQGGTATVADAFIDRIGTHFIVNHVDAGPFAHSELTLERIAIAHVAEVALDVDHPPAIIRLNDIRTRGGRRPLRFGVLLEEEPVEVVMNRVLVETATQSDAAGIEFQSSIFRGRDVIIRGVEGVGLEGNNSRLHLERFLVEGNAIGLQAKDATLLDGTFRNNGTAWLRGRAPRVDQVVGVSFDGNGVGVE